MHFPYIVVLNKDDYANSQDARESAESLLTENGFCGDGYFNCGKADWFVVGGRWSGYLKDWEQKDYVNRNAYDTQGHDDDAQICTQSIIDNMEKGNAFKKSELTDSVIEYFDPDNFETGELSKELMQEWIDKKWLVMIDYHN